MNRLSRGFSAACLAALLLFAVTGPEPFGLPDGEQAPPYSKPGWMDRETAGTILLSSESGELSWNHKPPLRVSVTGRLDSGSVNWTTPERTFILTASPGEVDLDARDVPFKRALGIDPFANMPKELFPSRGEYRLWIDGEGEAVMKIEGGRWGMLGTDHRGRDVVALFVRGIRVSLIIGLTATLIASALGVSLGLLSGYAGGLTDSLIMRTVDVLLSIPTLPVLMVLAGVWGKGLWNLVVVLSIFSWMGTARAVRAMTLTLREAPWVEGLRALGAKKRYIIFRHLLPEVLPLLLANIALGVPGTILAEAGMSFLGLSDPRLPSWGRMLHEAHVYGAFTGGAWWAILPPGLGIALICLIFMNLGRKLEERADPRLAANVEAETLKETAK
jgi:peptide/nickel transport system permease protein